MRIRDGFNYTEVCGNAMVIPMGETNIDLTKIFSLNDTTKYLWSIMQKGDFTADDLLQALLSEYDVDETTARHDIEALLQQLQQEGIIE